FHCFVVHLETSSVLDEVVGAGAVVCANAGPDITMQKTAAASADRLKDMDAAPELDFPLIGRTSSLGFVSRPYSEPGGLCRPSRMTTGFPSLYSGAARTSSA